MTNQLMPSRKSRKKLRSDIANCKDRVKEQALKSKRNKILRKIHKKIQPNEEKRVDALVENISQAPKNIKAFKALNILLRGKKEQITVKDEEGRNVTDPHEIHDFLKKYYHSHFHKDTATEVQSDINKPLDVPISEDEVLNAVKKMKNGKAPGSDEIHLELIKYGPPSLVTKITNLLNMSFDGSEDIECGHFGSKARKSERRCQKPSSDNTATCTEKNTVAYHDRQTQN